MVLVLKSGVISDLVVLKRLGVIKRGCSVMVSACVESVEDSVNNAAEVSL